MLNWTKYLKYVLISHLIFISFLSSPLLEAKNCHYKLEGTQSHIVRSIECTKGHIQFLLEIDIGRRHQVCFIIDAILKGILWDFPPAVLRDLRILE